MTYRYVPSIVRSISLSLILAIAFSFAFDAGTASALEREEIQALNFLVINSRNDEVRDAWKVLQDEGVIKVRPEKQWELALIYTHDRTPEVARAIVALQEGNILSTKPVNWEGSDNAVEMLIDKEEIYPRALDMISRAKRNIRFNIFLWGGKIGRDIVKGMKAAQDRGVSVQIITQPDSENSAILQKIQAISNKIVGEEPLPAYAPVKGFAAEQGLTIGAYPTKLLNGSAIVKADHNKVLSIDGKEAMIGGMNFADVISQNHDLMLWIKGPAVRELDDIFAENWRLCNMPGMYANEANPIWRDDDILDAATAKRCRDLARVRVAYSNALMNCTRGMVEQLIDNAKTKIRIMMFTFTDDVIVKKVIAAKKRGVDVKALLDPNVHAFGLRLMGAPNISTVRQLKKVGIEVRAYKTKPGNQMHIKAAMVDDKYSLFGSTNWTQAGFDSNNETYISVESAEVAEDFQALFDLDWEENSYVLKSKGAGKWFLATVAELVDGLF